MPQTTPEWRANATEQELRTRATEMRSEWSELTKSDRESDTFRSAKKSFLAEMEDIDVNLNLHGQSIEQFRAAPRGVMGGDGEPAEMRSMGRQLVDNAGFRAWCAENANREHLTGPSPTVELREPTEYRALVTLGSSNNLTLPVQTPDLIGVRRRRFFLEDLLSSATVSQAAVPYIRELNAATNETAADVVAEGATKPEATIEFDDDLAVVTVIAVNIPVTTQMLQDNSFIESYIEQRLRYMIDVRREAELLSGAGTGAHIRGILNTTGVQTQAAVSGETAVTLGNAILKVENTLTAPSAVVMNPGDAWAMYMKNRTAGWDAGSPFQGSPANVWGLPVLTTANIAAGTALVADFAQGATVLNRLGTFVRTYEQHSDFAVKNKVLIQAEQRVGLMVTNPDYFVVTTIA